MPTDPIRKIEEQIKRAGLPANGAIPYRPQLTRDRTGRPMIQKAAVARGPKAGKRGYVDDTGRIWIRDRAHGAYPDHWDVQANDGSGSYVRVDDAGNLLT